MGEQNYEEALEVVEKLLEKNSKNMDFLLLKADICFRSDRMFECEEVFLYILNLKSSAAQAYSIYLRLALTYLNRKSWEDARFTFNKAVEIKPNSAAGWMGLGIATLELGLLKESEEAFNLSSIYNPLSK
jgi:tetratricopeptide (TPR) repeat protein